MSSKRKSSKKKGTNKPEPTTVQEQPATNQPK